MIIRKGIIALSLFTAAASQGCKEDDEGDDSAAGIERTHQPTAAAIPDGFKNTAASYADFETRSTAVNNELIGGVTVALGVATATPGGLHLLDDGTASAPQTNIDLSSFMGEVATDCNGYFTFIASSLKTALGALDYFKSASATIGASQDLSTLAALYVVEDLSAESNGKFMFHLRLTPKAGVENPLARLGTLTVGGGATGKELAVQFGIANKVDTEQLKTETNVGYDIYGNTEAKTLQLGLAYAVSVTTGGGEPVGMNLKTDLTLQGGDMPSLTAIMDFDGTDSEGNKAPGNFRYHLAKTGENTFTLSWNGAYINQSVSRTLQVTKSAAGCVVNSVQ